MSTSDQRRQWADHIRDESDARRLEQAAAGSTHSPVGGPLPYTEDQLAAAVAEAVAAERRRCADIADSWSGEPRLLAAFADLTGRELHAAMETARAVAGEIRNGA